MNGSEDQFFLTRVASVQAGAPETKFLTVLTTKEWL
jgi:hypothetical protein